MFMQILTRTPTWVFILLAALIALGVWQSRPQRTSVTRQTVTPLVFTALSLFGVLSAFHGNWLTILVWLVAVTVTALPLMRTATPVGTTFDAASRQFSIPGSWTPLVIMMGIFAVKFAVGVSLGLHPDWATNIAFAATVCTAYGALSGVLLGRGLRLVRLAKGQQGGQSGGPQAPRFV
jgi:hypothetical protein